MRNAILAAASLALSVSALAVTALGLPALAADVLPPGFETKGATEAFRAIGIGAQIYACKAAPDGRLKWTYRDPVATLIDAAGTTMARHFAGPTWEATDGSAIVGKAVATAPGATAGDVPLLKLDVASSSGKGVLTGVTHALRLATHGGALAGDCFHDGDLQAVPYSATYVFLKG